ncbi:phosphoribosylanthranilate isomerase [Herbaspirillum sp. RTI4]|uniref:phosphoribosylanthranilate isomerase n=1 Tax=Herbaspirillum sp. RTI4 TaxID=3048640 RepID=UPI002AB56400|nr:phosphoribosylanthranilate isomerase [Herbaspirillum sp. RTI4]MDY7578037.1 phosphoribosylanthranilate isomerase [Herbaspirillum sp. RTI4]MEA9983167.1 phosphoribosylanthranilate isomerase [Herbaspirillum sp. RTI4]
MNLHRTRIKICGLTRAEDVAAAVAAGADAIGMVFYAPSPRCVTIAQAAALTAALPPFVSSVGLFVNADVDYVAQVLDSVPLSVLQFHGDETPQQCAAIAAAVKRPFLRAARVGSATNAADLLQWERDYQSASPYFTGLLLDTLVEQYGGSGKVFDWSVIPEELAPRVVLSGGLSARNITDAVLRVRPYAIDVSSGVEQAKGIKDPALIESFVAAVHAADAADVAAGQRTPSVLKQSR